MPSQSTSVAHTMNAPASIPHTVIPAKRTADEANGSSQSSGNKKSKIRKERDAILALHSDLLKSRWATLFRKPVRETPGLDNDVIEEYEKLIRNPIDLRTIKRKYIEDPNYGCTDYFKDFKLMINNCLYFNKDPNDFTHQTAMKLLKQFENKWMQLFPPETHNILQERGPGPVDSSPEFSAPPLALSTSSSVQETSSNIAEKPEPIKPQPQPLPQQPRVHKASVSESQSNQEAPRLPAVKLLPLHSRPIMSAEPMPIKSERAHPVKSYDFDYLVDSHADLTKAARKFNASLVTKRKEMADLLLEQQKLQQQMRANSERRAHLENVLHDADEYMQETDFLRAKLNRAIEQVERNAVPGVNYEPKSEVCSTLNTVKNLIEWFTKNS